MPSDTSQFGRKRRRNNAQTEKHSLADQLNQAEQAGKDALAREKKALESLAGAKAEILALKNELAAWKAENSALQKQHDRLLRNRQTALNQDAKNEISNLESRIADLIAENRSLGAKARKYTQIVSLPLPSSCVEYAEQDFPSTIQVDGLARQWRSMFDMLCRCIRYDPVLPPTGEASQEQRAQSQTHNSVLQSMSHKFLHMAFGNAGEWPFSYVDPEENRPYAINLETSVDCKQGDFAAARKRDIIVYKQFFGELLELDPEPLVRPKAEALAQFFFTEFGTHLQPLVHETPVQELLEKTFKEALLLKLELILSGKTFKILFIEPGEELREERMVSIDSLVNARIENASSTRNATTVSYELFPGLAQYNWGSIPNMEAARLRSIDFFSPVTESSKWNGYIVKAVVAT